MRRLGLVLLVFTLVGCDALRDAFSAHPDAAARADGQTLSVDRLAQLVAHAKRVPLQQQAVASLATVYADHLLFALAVARGDSLRDSAVVLQAMWPLASQMKWEHFHDRLMAERTVLTPVQVDSAYAAGGARLFQHILLQVPPSAAPTVEQEKRRKIETALRQATARRGANFAQLAARYSEDPGSKTQGGALGVAERGQFVQAFEDAAWQLEPGAMSSVVRSPFGFHLIRRPPLAEVRDSFRAGLENRLAFRLDSLYLDSLATLRRIKVLDGAPARTRQAVRDLESARDDGSKLVSFRGGSFQVRDLVQWVYALDPQVFQGLPNATDDQIRQFLKVLAQRNLLLIQADSVGVTLGPEDWRQLRTEHDSALTVLRSVLGLSPELLRDSAATEEERVRLVAARVDSYMERVLRGQAPFVAVPPFLAGVLRSRASWSLSPAGIARALERAQALRGAADSLAGPPPRASTGLQPAPGPAPVPPSDTAGSRPETR